MLNAFWVLFVENPIKLVNWKRKRWSDRFPWKYFFL